MWGKTFKGGDGRENRGVMDELFDGGKINKGDCLKFVYWPPLFTSFVADDDKLVRVRMFGSVETRRREIRISVLKVDRGKRGAVFLFFQRRRWRIWGGKNRAWCCTRRRRER